MNAFSLGISNSEKESILSQHKQIYNGYKTLNPSPVANEQPLYVQDFANDKDGMTVNNKGEVMKYTNIGINESKSNMDEFFYFDEKDENEIEKRKEDLDMILSKMSNKVKPYLDDDDATDIHPYGESDWNKPKEMGEVEGMCEQCGLNESMCECGTNEETNENINEENIDEYSTVVRTIGDNIWKSEELQDMVNQTDSSDFGDEFEYADNIISWSLDDYYGSEFYDELYDYMKQQYSEYLFDIYMSENSDEFDDDDDDDDLYNESDSSRIDENEDMEDGEELYPSFDSDGDFIGMEKPMGDMHDEMVEDIDDGEVASDVEPAYQFQSHGPEDVYGTLKDYDKNHPHHDYNSMEDVAEYDPSSDLENMFPDLDFGRAFSNEPSDTFQHDAGDVDRMGDEGLGQDTENDMDLGGVGSGYDFESDGADQSVYMGEEEDIEEEVDDDLKESFKTQKTKILEMFNRFNKYN